MPLQSKLFSGDRRLEACLVSDASHVTPGSRGDFVTKIQTALTLLSAGPGRPSVFLKPDGIYGPRTADAVQAYKDERDILGPGQDEADNIVGKLTIKSLDDEMSILEEESPASDGLVASDPFGQPHDHSQCPLPSTNPEIELAPDGTMSHFGTPMNPLAFGRMVCVGGATEVAYLGFEDVVPDPKLDPHMPADQVHGRLFTRRITSHTVSDICFRSAPVDAFMREKEISRLCMRGARLTIVGNRESFDDGMHAFARRIGIIEQSGFLIEKAGQPAKEDRQFLVIKVLKVT